MLTAGSFTEPESHRIFKSSVRPCLMLTPDFFIVGANDAYLASTFTDLAEIDGKYMFEIFPDNPELDEANGVRNLGASLEMVRELQTPHFMPIQRYDIRGADRQFVERHWHPANFPIVDDRSRLVYILHHVQAVASVPPSPRWRGENGTHYPYLQQSMDMIAQSLAHLNQLGKSSAEMDAMLKIMQRSPLNVRAAMINRPSRSSRIEPCVQEN